jgi:hypothetical protein
MDRNKASRSMEYLRNTLVRTLVVWPESLVPLTPTSHPNSDGEDARSAGDLPTKC